MRFTLDGQTNDLPAIDGLTLDEAILLEKYAGAGVETFVSGNTPMGAVKALMVIGLVRTGMPEAQASTLVGAVKLVDLDTILEAEEDAAPLAAPSSNGQNGSLETSGPGGQEPLAHIRDVSLQAATGFRDSDTGATSGQQTLAD